MKIPAVGRGSLDAAASWSRANGEPYQARCEALVGWPLKHIGCAVVDKDGIVLSTE
jgi:hypothetical protein